MYNVITSIIIKEEQSTLLKKRNLTNEIIRKEMGLRIRKMRKETGATIDDIAEALDISPGYLSTIERGKRGLSPEGLVVFSDYFHCTADFLLTGEEKFPQVELLGHSQVCKLIDVQLHEPTKQKLAEFLTTILEQKQVND